MADTWKPTYDLEAFKQAAPSVRVTVTALKAASSLGFNRNDITDIIKAMQRQQFYKSMTYYADYRIWQDVYHVPSAAGMLYVKFSADTVTEFVLLSFKEKGDG